jgi:Dolichyl-phosphate-mannose-protein mannosyltransferase
MPQIQSIRLKQLWQYGVHQSITLPLVLLLVILVLVISPVGEFPLNDDWIYTKTVQHLLQTGHYQAHPYLNATLVAQTYWGAIFCKLFGFSFTTLRVSTLVLAFMNAWAVAQCALTMGIKRNLALLCAVITATSPLVLQLSYSFMTDIPFLTMSSLSGLFFLKALKQPKPQWAAWGSSFAVLAFLVRQFGILLPLAFGIVAVWLTVQKHYVFSRAMQVAVLAPWGFVIGIYLLWGNALTSKTPILEASHEIYGTAIDGIRHGPIALCYMGLFTLPLGIGRLRQILSQRKPWPKNRGPLFLGFCCISLFIFWLPQFLYWFKRLFFHKEAIWLQNYPYRMPLMVYRTLLDFGLGPLQLPDFHPVTTLQIHEGWWPITLIALGVSGLLFLALVDRWRDSFRIFGSFRNTDRNQDCFLAVWGILSLAAAYNPLRAVTLDRYLLPALVPFMLLLARDLAQNWPKAMKSVVLSTLCIGLFSLISLQDYLAWNQTAWTAHHRLETFYQVPSTAVKGIDTFNGWYNSDAYMKRHHTQSWWNIDVDGKGPWVLDDQYIIASVEPRPGYQVLERIPYFSWLGWQERNVLIFKRLGA